MPFEPRLVAHDDDGQDRLTTRARVEVDEFEAPDLEALAVQLGDDAEYLAKLYPPRVCPAEFLERRRGWSHKIGRGRVAAVVLWFAVAAAAVSAWGLANQDEPNYIASLSGSSEPSAHAISDPTAGLAFEQNPNFDASTTGVPPAAAPALRDANSNHVATESDFSALEPGDLLQDLSVPEQEAVFDLLESEPIELARISL